MFVALQQFFALTNLKEIDTMAIEDKLTAGLREYIKTYGKLPSAPDELVGRGIDEEGIPESPVGGKFIIAPKIKAVKNSVLAKKQIKHDLAFLNAKSERFKKRYGDYPVDLKELEEYVESETTGEVPVHPLGEEYIYNPETGKVKSGVEID